MIPNDVRDQLRKSSGDSLLSQLNNIAGIVSLVSKKSNAKDVRLPISEIKSRMEEYQRVIRANSNDIKMTGEEFARMRSSVNVLFESLTAFEKALNPSAFYGQALEIIREMNGVRASFQNMANRMDSSGDDFGFVIDDTADALGGLADDVRETSRKTQQINKLYDEMDAVINDFNASFDKLKEENLELGLKLERIGNSFSEVELARANTAAQRGHTADNPARRAAANLLARIKVDVPTSLLDMTQNAALDQPANSIRDIRNNHAQFRDLGRLRESKMDVERMSKLRDRNPMNRIMMAMWKESKSSRSRLLIVNIFKDTFIRPFKFLGKVLEGMVIEILNFPVRMLLGFGRKIWDSVSDAFVGMTSGDEAVAKRREDRGARREAEKQRRNEDLNDRLGVGIDKFVEAMDKYLGLINQSNIGDISRENVSERIETNREAIIELQAETTNKIDQIQERFENLTGNSMQDPYVSGLPGFDDGDQESEQFNDDLRTNFEEQTDLLTEIRDLMADTPGGGGEDGDGKKGGLMGLFGRFFGKFKKFLPAGLGAAAGGGGLLAGLGSKLMAGFRRIPLIAVISSFIAGIVDTVRDFESTGDILLDTFTFIKNLTRNIIGSFLGGIDALGNGIIKFINFFTGGLEDFSFNLRGVWEGLLDWFESGGLANFGAKAGIWLYDATQSVKKFASGMWEGFMDLLKDVGSFGLKFGARIKEWFFGLDDQIGKFVGESVNSIRKKIFSYFGIGDDDEERDSVGLKRGGEEASVHRHMAEKLSQSNPEILPDEVRKQGGRKFNDHEMALIEEAVATGASITSHVRKGNKKSRHFDGRAVDLAFGSVSYDTDLDPELLARYRRLEEIMNELGFEGDKGMIKGENEYKHRLAKHATGRHLHVGNSDPTRTKAFVDTFNAIKARNRMNVQVQKTIEDNERVRKKEASAKASTASGTPVVHANPIVNPTPVSVQFINNGPDNSFGNWAALRAMNA